MSLKIRQALALGLGLIAVAPSAGIADICDLSWVGSGLTAATSDSGHIVALRGSDGKLRLNEWREGSKSWSGWYLLPQQDNVDSDPWIQPKALGPLDPVTGLPTYGQNVFARTKTGIILQWIVRRNPSNGSIQIDVTNNVSNAAGTVGRPTSVQTTSGGQQKLFATFSDGTIRSRNWSGPQGYANGSWTTEWEYEGLGGVVGSPWAVQGNSGKVNLFARTSDGLIRQKVWNGSSWSSWTVIQQNASGDPSSIYAPKLGNRLWAFVGGGGPDVSTYAVNIWTDWDNSAYMPVVRSLAAVVSGGQEVLYGIGGEGVVWSKRAGAPAGRVNCMYYP